MLVSATHAKITMHRSILKSDSSSRISFCYGEHARCATAQMYLYLARIRILCDVNRHSLIYSVVSDSLIL